MENKKVRFSMTDEELKILRKSIEYVDIFKDDKEKQNSKIKRIKKVA